MIPPRLLSLAFLLCALASTANAHNGAVATAAPLTGIVIDGDFSDWPEDIERYPIALPEHGDLPHDEEDLRAFFRVGFNADANEVYVAVEVEDESIVLTDTSSAWDSQDGCEVYLSLNPNSSALQYRAYGDAVGSLGISARLSDIRLEIQRTADMHRYEWRFDLNAINKDSIRVDAESVLGFDVVAIDKDHDGTFTWATWGKGTSKTAFQRIGDLWLASMDHAPGILRGRLHWMGMDRGAARYPIVISRDNHDLSAKTDRAGRFSIELPSGSYGISLDKGSTIRTTVDIGAGDTTTVSFPRPLAKGQPLPDVQVRGHLQTFGMLEGLPGFIRYITQDDQGRMWFATGSGLSSYNGHRFTTLPLGDSSFIREVRRIEIDHDGHLWFNWAVNNTDLHGVSRYDGTEVISLPNTYRILSILATREKALWFGSTYRGVLGYDEENGKFIDYDMRDDMPSGMIHDIIEDRQGNVWFATPNGVARYDGKSVEIPDPLKDLVNTRHLHEDRKGHLWLNSDGNLARYNGKTATVFTSEDGLPEGNITSISEDAFGHIWTAHGWRDLARYDGQRFTRIGKKDGLVYDFITNIFADKEGSLWFGTPRNAIRYDEAHRANFVFTDSLADARVNCLMQDRSNNLWMGGFDYIKRYDGVEFTLFTYEDGLPLGGLVTDIEESGQGDLWIATAEGGVSKYDGKTFENYDTSDGLTANTVNDIFSDSQGLLWFATSKGVCYFDGEAFHSVTEEQDWATTVETIVIAEDLQGHLWFGTFSWNTADAPSGLIRFDGETFTDFRGEGMSGNIRDLTVDDAGNLWVASDNGLSSYDSIKFQSIKMRQESMPENAKSLLLDRSGRLWVGSIGAGISRYDGHTFQYLNENDGLSSNIIRDIIQTRDGHIWIASEGGLTRYLPHSTSPPVQITRIAADRDYPTDQLVRLPSSQRNLNIHFEGISFRTRPGQMLYAYRLKGHDDEWRYTREDRVEYAGLPVGEYTFEVKAVDIDLNYSEQPATAEIEVYYRPMSSSVYIADVEVEDLFASFYKTYANRSLGSVRVINDDPNPVAATLRFYLPELMRRPAEQKLDLAPQSKQRIDLFATLGEELLAVEGTQLVEAEIELACQIGEQTISVKETQSITVHGPGALTWDRLGRAAAFVTPDDPAIAQLARGLLEEHRHLVEGRKVDGHIPLAMLLYEALNIHGIHYAQDASTPYAQLRADKAAVDHIQYPNQLLQSRLGDCDDCTVLYCSLLENLNIATAFVDAPGHILMLFDSGVVEDQRGYGFSLPERQYVERGGRLWIPVEVTMLGEGSFMEAWASGARTCQRLAEAGELKITYVRAAWADFAYALPGGSAEVELPDAGRLKDALWQDLLGLKQWRQNYLDRTYLSPLLENPQNHRLRLALAKTHIEAEDYSGAISVLTPLIDTSLKADALYHIGISYAMQDNFSRAAHYIEQAARSNPQNDDFSRALAYVKRKLRE